MGVLRTRSAGPVRSNKAGWSEAREGTFEAHLPRSWTVSSAQTGNHYTNPEWRPSRPRPPSAMSKMLSNPNISQAKITSEAIGMHTGMRPGVRPRPASDATIMMCNPAVRDGHVSSEVVGRHTGVPPRLVSRMDDPCERTHLPSNRLGRPRTAPIWTSTLRASDAIGAHPRPETPDLSDAAVMHFEAQFSHRFGDGGGSIGAVMANKMTAAAAEFQKQWIARARELNEKEAVYQDGGASKSIRIDGQLMEKMDFDAVYSNKHTHKDTESAIGNGFVPTIDVRKSLTRPADVPYGRVHMVQTAYGPREPLPTRSVMGIGTGKGRSVDF